MTFEYKFKGGESVSYAHVMVRRTKNLEFSLSEMGSLWNALVKKMP